MLTRESPETQSSDVSDRESVLGSRSGVAWYDIESQRHILLFERTGRFIDINKTTLGRNFERLCGLTSGRRYVEGVFGL